MMTTMRLLAACGMLGAATAGASAGGDGVRVGVRVSLGGFGIRVSEPCRPVICQPVICEPVVCEPVRYREEVIWETVPRTEVWYDSCGVRHTRTVYVRECRTIRVPIERCEPVVVVHGGHGHYGHWSHRGDDDRHGHRRGWDDERRGRDDDDRRHGDRGDDRREGREGSGRDGRREAEAARPVRPEAPRAAAPPAPARPVAQPARPAAPAKVIGAGSAGVGKSDLKSLKPSLNGRLKDLAQR